MDESPQDAPIDRYVVLEYLAEGGMGAIYLGKKLGAGGFEKEVVLKQLLPEFTRQPEFIDLFLREARLSATLDHANIVHTIDLVTAGEEHFIVMEYVDGGDLRTLLKRAKRRHQQFSASAAIFIARELLSALAYAHNKMDTTGRPLDLIHRDISPSNVLISRGGEVKLTDFGIAKASTHNSVFYRVKGKVGYMSPEQARSEPVDARSDLYSLAVCVYEMITGERLFISVGLTTSAEEMYNQDVPSISDKVPGLPDELDGVMHRALAVDPDIRYQTAGEFQDAILRCAHRNGLMMSAPDLAEHLHEVCGPPSAWKDVEDRDPSDGVGGTEIYDATEGTEEIRLDEEIDFSDDYSANQVLYVAGGGTEKLLDEGRQRKKREQTSITHLGDLQGIELTSMLKIALGEHAGAEPLVDLGSFSEAAFRQPDQVTFSRADTGFPVGPDGATLPGPQSATPNPTARVRAESAPLTMTPTPLPHPEGRRPVDVRDAMAPDRRPWLILIFILLVGVGTAMAIGLSGPSLEGGDAPSETPANGPVDVPTPDPATTNDNEAS